jgi:hypothetical protein
VDFRRYTFFTSTLKPDEPERTMEAKSQMMSIGLEKLIAVHHANAERPDRPLHSIPDSFRPQYHQPAEMMTDLEYTKFMEESYGILEEGVF